MTLPAAPVTPAGRLDGALVIVTGAARGIGAAIAARCRAEGGRIAIVDRVDEGAITAAALNAAFVRADLADPDEARRATGDAVSALGGVDVLVNCAGILRRGPLLDTTAEEWDAVFAVNARAVLLTMQVAAAAMIAAGSGGRIVNIASMAAKSGGGHEAAYAASKAAVVALTRAAAMEWGPAGITVNALCPGFVLTEMGAATRTAADIATWTARSPLGRLGEPEDVAAAACFLASADGAYLTGQALNVTGGMITH